MDHDKFVELYAASDELLNSVQCVVYSNNEEARDIRYRMESEAGIKSTSDMAIMALLAQNCKIMKNSAYSGFRSSPCGEKDMEIERRFLSWYDKELRLHGFQYKLLFAPWHKKTEFRAGDITVAIPVSERPEITNGTYFWEPIRAFASCGKSVVIQESNPEE